MPPTHLQAVLLQTRNRRHIVVFQLRPTPLPNAVYKFEHTVQQKPPSAKTILAHAYYFARSVSVYLIVQKTKSRFVIYTI